MDNITSDDTAIVTIPRIRFSRGPLRKGTYVAVMPNTYLARHAIMDIHAALGLGNRYLDGWRPREWCVEHDGIRVYIISEHNALEYMQGRIHGIVDYFIHPDCIYQITLYAELESRIGREE